MLLALRLPHCHTTREGETPFTREDALLTAFYGRASLAAMAAGAEAEKLIGFEAGRPMSRLDIAVHQLASVTDHLPGMIPVLDESPAFRGHQLLEAHRRVRSPPGAKGSYPA